MKNKFWLILFSAFLFTCDMPSESSEAQTAGIDTEKLQGQSGVKDDVSEKNILNIAAASPDHTTLATAAVAAGLQDVLTNAGPLTVFAPTNEAFDKLPAGTVEDLLKPENKEKLANIITYHAAPGSYDADHIKGVMGIGQATGDKCQWCQSARYGKGIQRMGTCN
ncbi:MAG: fasciclin domain-containing protein [Saprospiraceae bacterium]|nr:fasciclin domain-containing protein [Saprospiraceae bacterium]